MIPLPILRAEILQWHGHFLSTTATPLSTTSVQHRGLSRIISFGFNLLPLVSSRRSHCQGVCLPGGPVHGSTQRGRAPGSFAHHHSLIPFGLLHGSWLCRRTCLFGGSPLHYFGHWGVALVFNHLCLHCLSLPDGSSLPIPMPWPRRKHRLHRAMDIMSPNKSGFISYKKVFSLNVWMGNNSYIPVLGQGSVIVALNGNHIFSSGMLYTFLALLV